MPAQPLVDRIDEEHPLSGRLVLVLGATGKTGRRLTERLTRMGVSVRAASRSGETRFDWSDAPGWDGALRDVSDIYIIAPEDPGPVHPFVERARAAGVARLALLSGRGADDWGASGFGRGMLSAESAVRGSGLDWTIVRSSNFSQNFDEENFHAPLLAGRLALPAGDVPEPFIDIEDVVDVIAAVLTQPGHTARTYELSGPRPLTFREATELIAAATGRDIVYSEVSTEEYVRTLLDQGLDEEAATNVAAMFSMMRTGIIAETTHDVEAVLGRPPVSFESYVDRVAQAGAWDERT